MLDVRQLRLQGEILAEALLKKGYTLDLAHFRELDARRKTADTASQGLLAERKQASKQIGVLLKQGVAIDEAKKQVAEILQRIESELDALVDEAKQAQAAIDDLLMEIPNCPDDAVPAGRDEADNIEISRWGEPINIESPADHVALGEALGMMDFEAAAKLTGSRFSVLRGGMARLHRGLAQFMLDIHTLEHGYEELYVPYIVNADSLRGTGQLPKFAEDLFSLGGDSDYYLIPTAEVPVTNLLRDRIVEADELGEGLAMVTHTPCFRSEAGSYGKDTRGMIRQHQFEKVELVQAVPAGRSDEALETLTGHAEVILQRLQLPYRKVLLCGGDLGFSAVKTYDLEVWLPAQGCYREISSCSNFKDYQARRMQARWRNPETGKPELLHTLNGSGLAVGRCLVAVLENGQQPDGSILIPAALRPYVGGMERLSV